MIYNRKKKIVNFPYLRRTEEGRTKSNMAENFYKYQLQSLAKNNIYIVDIYKHFFLSVLTKGSSFNQQLSPNHISKFFRIFMCIVALRNLIGITRSLSGSIIAFVKDFVDQRNNNEEDRFLSIFIKKEINQIYQQRFPDIVKSIKIDYALSYREVEFRIGEQLKAFYEKLDDKNYFEQIKSNQVLPSALDDNSLKRFIKNNFRCICNIRVFRSSYKKEVWQQFDSINKLQWPQLKIMMIKETGILQNNANINQVYLPKQTKQKQPVITRIQNCLLLIRKRQKHHQLLMELNKQILTYCLHYHIKTNRFYPNLSIKDIIFDQKKIAATISHNFLVLQAIGLKGDTKNFQLRLATESTPTAINFQQCYLETVQQNKAQMNRKYYCPKPKVNPKQNIQYLYEESKVKSQDVLLQQIHVFRLINIFYFIANNRHFSVDYYEGKIISKNEPTPFYYKTHVKYLKEFYQLVLNNEVSLKQIIPLPKHWQQKQFKSDKQSELMVSFKKLKNYFKLEIGEDSLLQNLKLDKLTQFYSERNQLINQIDRLMFSQFKKVPNAKKYLLSFCICTFEEIYFRKCIIEISKTKGGVNLALLRQQYKNTMLNTSFLKQAGKRKKRKLDSLSKLQQYNQKPDTKGKIFKDNTSIFPHIETIENLLQEIQVISGVQQIFVDKKKQIHQYLLDLKEAKQFHIQDSELLKLLSYSTNLLSMKEISEDKKLQNFNSIQSKFQKIIQDKIIKALEIHQKLLKFIQEDLYKQLQKGVKVHDGSNWKAKQQEWPEACGYWNKRLGLLIKLYFNFRQEHYLSFLRLKPLIQQKLFTFKDYYPPINIQIQKLTLAQEQIDRWLNKPASQNQ